MKALGDIWGKVSLTCLLWIQTAKCITCATISELSFPSLPDNHASLLPFPLQRLLQRVTLPPFPFLPLLDFPRTKLFGLTFQTRPSAFQTYQISTPITSYPEPPDMAMTSCRWWKLSSTLFWGWRRLLCNGHKFGSLGPVGKSSVTLPDTAEWQALLFFAREWMERIARETRYLQGLPKGWFPSLPHPTPIQVLRVGISVPLWSLLAFKYINHPPQLHHLLKIIIIRAGIKTQGKNNNATLTVFEIAQEQKEDYPEWNSEEEEKGAGGGCLKNKIK